MASPALPSFPDEGLLHELDPEQRLVAAVFRRALQDVEDRRVSELDKARARAFLAGAGSFTLLCAVGHLEPARVVRLAFALQGCP